MYSLFILAAGESLQVTRTLSYWKCDTAKVPPGCGFIQWRTLNVGREGAVLAVVIKR